LTGQEAWQATRPYPTKKNRIGPVPRLSGLNPMRLAQVGLGFGVGLPGIEQNRSIPVRSASYFSLPETPDNYRYLNPG
jgi:hypothetical protein